MVANLCIFCLDEQKFPHRISCGHSFCAECFEKFLELSRDSRCPLCRRDFHPPPPPPEDFEEDPELIVPRRELEMDTLALTLTEQECRFFEQLFREVQLTRGGQ
ncbi:RING-H2 finger protein ATL29 [Drosophila eugracilis]|uniref:RING-H2 finger protein ATL29 n=1 Tax=Drosophila eugracilis TaxID=29029 RepID=UPI0007E78718|nr:RING-H2 finger protein ATL29 [Drosophila eugracilis]